MAALLRRVRWGNVGRLAALLAAGVLIATAGRGCGDGVEPAVRSSGGTDGLEAEVSEQSAGLPAQREARGGRPPRLKREAQGKREARGKRRARGKRETRRRREEPAKRDGPAKLKRPPDPRPRPGPAPRQAPPKRKPQPEPELRAPAPSSPSEFRP